MVGRNGMRRIHGRVFRRHNSDEIYLQKELSAEFKPSLRKWDQGDYLGENFKILQLRDGAGGTWAIKVIGGGGVNGQNLPF